MSFKYFRPTVRKVSTTPKAPAFKNTATAERFADLLDASDILANHSVEKHLAEVNFDDHGHSILKESGLTRGHSIIETSFGDQLAGRDSILGGFGKHIEPQFGADGARAAGAFGKGMAASDGNDNTSSTEMTITDSSGTYNESSLDNGEDTYTGDVSDPLDGIIGGALVGAAKHVIASAATATAVAPGLVTAVVVSATIGGLITYTNDAVETLTPVGGVEGVVNDAFEGTAFDSSQPGHNYSQRPGGDDSVGGEVTLMAWKLQEKLSNGFKNAKDPIINPSDDNQGGGVLTATELKEMEADLRNAKDPATNWGDDTYNNFMGAIEMNVGEISLKAPATNWGDNYTSTTANVVETVFATVQDF